MTCYACTGTPAAKVPGQSAPAVLTPGKEPDNNQLRERLKEDILRCGEGQQPVHGIGFTMLKAGIEGNFHCILEMTPCAIQSLTMLTANPVCYPGGTWDEGWTVESKMRTSGTTAGSWDSVRPSF